MNTLHRFLLSTIAAAALFSCAKESEESSQSVQKRILQAFIETNYPGTEPTASGLYIVDSIPGTGRTPDKSSYVLVDYIITYLDGTYVSYTGDSIARQLGTFTYSGYYHPRIWSLEDNTSGIIELLTGMKEGGMVKAVIPAVLLDEESGKEISQGDGSSKIYEIYLREVIDDAYQYQIDQLEEFSATHYGGLDSTEYGFYFKNLHPLHDTITSSHHVNVRYVGKYMDGKVFDTNVEDTARKYRIYSSGNTYSALSFQFEAKEDNAVDENSFIQGFSKALWRMGYGDHSVTFFYSNLGYGDNGSGDIPAYVPLFFELWIEEYEEDN